MPVLERLGLRNLRDLPLNGDGDILSSPFYTSRPSNAPVPTIGNTNLIVSEQHLNGCRCQERLDRQKKLQGITCGCFRCGLLHDGPMSPERQKLRVYYRCPRFDACSTTTIRRRQDITWILTHAAPPVDGNDASGWKRTGETGRSKGLREMRGIELQIARTSSSYKPIGSTN
jgi:hypothetical protein